MKNDTNKALRLLESSVENLSQHTYDNFIEKNADSMLRTGVKTVIIRRQVGKCCKWCAGMTGIYDFSSGDYPKDIFRRHANCKCLVTTKTEKGGYTNVWNKIEYKSQRDARKEREKEIGIQDDNLNDFKRRISEARSRGDKFVDATDYWLNKEKEFPAETEEIKGDFKWNGENYNTKQSGVLPKPGLKEKEFAEWWAERYGGKIIYVPRILKPQRVRTPDYLINGIKYELKSPSGSGRWVIDHQVSEATGQANKLFVDITASSLKNDLTEITRQVSGVFKSNDYSWLEDIILVADRKVLFAAKRV